MGIYKTETKKMAFNGYNYKAEWSIENFLSFIGNDYNSPLFSSDNFQVQLSIKNSLSKNNDGLEITFNFTSIPSSGLSLNYTLIIENADSNKAEKIIGDEVLSNSKKEFKIFSKTQGDQITKENGFIQDGALKISCFFHANTGIETDSSSFYNHDKIKREVVADVNWSINHALSEFHSTEEPLQVSIKDKILSFALIFELTEINTYSLSLVLIQPEFSFSGEIEITLNNQKDNQKSITKKKKLKFDSTIYELDPIGFDEVTQDDLMGPENGWVLFDDKDTSKIESGLNFDIKFVSLEREEESKESVFYRLSQMQVYNEKELRDTIPITINPISSNKFDFEIVFQKVLEQDLNQTISSPEYFTGGICERYKLDFPSKSFIFEVTDFPQSGSFMSAQITFINQDPSKSFTIKLSFLYCASKLTDSKELPFSLQDLKNPEKGWLFDGDLKIRARFEAKNYNKSYLYPVTTNASSSDLYGFLFFIPMSLFNPDNEMKIIDFPPVNSKKLNMTPFINYSYDEQNKLNIQTNFDINIPKEESIIDFIFSYENKDQEKNFTSTFANVEVDHIQMPLFVPEKSLEEDGFVFQLKSKKVLHFYLRIHYKEKNSYTASSSDYPSSIYYNNYTEEKKAQDESKMHAMLPDRSLTAEQQLQQENNRRNKKDYFDKYIDDYQIYNDDAVTGPHDFTSKKETGYVGLKNQGATCYMNSLLQTLYHLPAFRRLVYEMPTTGNEDPNTSIPLNLQRLFCKMQFSDRTCSTVNLTKSFGWGSAETFQQHDIEEFLRVLIDNLENKMKGTDLKDTIPHLFRGKYRNYIKCINVDYQSVREESFYDLSMDVKGIPNLIESFKSYVKQDTLTGDNQYNAESFGKQDAIMGTEFIEFPPVLHLHLRRFMFDYNLKNGMYKINDQFIFPESIDLTPFLADDSPSREKSNVYDLYGVLVHQGGVLGGHYYAFLRTSTSPQWYKFNDSFVTKDTAQHAIVDNYGYSPNSPNPPEMKEGRIDENEDNNNNNNNNNDDDTSSSGEENEQNEGTELDEIINDNEREFVQAQSAQMGIDICGGRRDDDDIHIHGRGDDYTEWEKHHREVFDHDHYREQLKRDYHKNHNKTRRAPHGPHHHRNPSPPRSEKTYSGYILIYVRREDAESIFEPISDESVPEHLKDYMNNLVKEEKSSAKDKTTIEVHFAHENILKTNSANKIIGFFPPESPKPEKKSEEQQDQDKTQEKQEQQQEEQDKDKEPVKVDISKDTFTEKFEKSISTSEFYTLIASKLGLDPSKIRLWRCGYGNLPTRIIPNSATSNVAGISDCKNYMTVFIQSIKEEENEKLDIGDKFMIYIKFFFSEDLLKKQSQEDRNSLLNKQLHAPLQFLFSTTVNRDDKIESLIPLLNEKLGFPADSKLEAFQETLNKTVQKAKLTTTFMKSSIGSGSTLIFEMDPESIEKIQQDSLKINFNFAFPSHIEEETETEINHQVKLFKQNDLDNNKNPLKSIQNFIEGDNTITLEIYDYKDQEKPLFLIQFSRDIKMNEAKKFIIKAYYELNNIKEEDYDMSSILLFRMKNNEITKLDIDQLISNQILRFHFNDEPQQGSKYHKLYFYISPFKGHKTTDFIKYTIEFSADAKSVDATKIAYLPIPIKCKEIYEVFKSLFKEEEKEKMFNDTNKYRYLLIDSQVIERVFTHEAASVPYEAKKTFRIEVVPKNQIDVDQNKLLRCFYTIDNSRGISPPFLINVIDNEVFIDTKKRLREYMDLGQNDQMDTYKFFLSVESLDTFDKQTSKRMERAKTFNSLNPDANVCEIYEVNSFNNNKVSWITLDDFAMISEFAEDSTFNLQLVIKLSKNKQENDNDAAVNHGVKIDDGDKDKNKDKVKVENKPSRPQAKPHPSHNDVRIYN